MNIKNLEKLHHCTYKTTHRSGKYYVGRHSTDNINDGYMGSGKWVKSIKDRTSLIVEIIAYYNSYEELLVAEQLLIEQYFDDPNCMNYLKSSIGAAPGQYSGENHPNYRKITSTETKNKISQSLKGRTHSEESKQKMSAFQKNRPPISEESRKKISESLTGKICKESTRKKISDAQLGEKNHRFGKGGEEHPMFGKKHSIESLEKMSVAQTGRKHTEDWKQKMSISRKRENLSQETRNKLSLTTKGVRNPNSKLTDDIVREIKIKLNIGVKGTDLAKEYGVTPSTISDIKNGRIWKHVIV